MKSSSSRSPDGQTDKLTKINRVGVSTRWKTSLPSLKPANGLAAIAADGTGRTGADNYFYRAPLCVFFTSPVHGARVGSQMREFSYFKIRCARCAWEGETEWGTFHAGGPRTGEGLISSPVRGPALFPENERAGVGHARPPTDFARTPGLSKNKESFVCAVSFISVGLHVCANFLVVFGTSYGNGWARGKK